MSAERRDVRAADRIARRRCHQQLDAIAISADEVVADQILDRHLARPRLHRRDFIAEQGSPEVQRGNQVVGQLSDVPVHARGRQVVLIRCDRGDYAIGRVAGSFDRLLIHSLTKALPF